MADQTLARFVNERSILTLLRRQGPLSRAEIARSLNLTPATITRLVVDLTRHRLVREIRNVPARSGSREPGRPGVQIALDPSGAYFLGVEIGVGVLRLALIDLAVQAVRTEEIPVSRSFSPEAVVALIAERLRALEAEKAYRGRIRAAGLTVPGLVTLEGFVVNLPILGWAEVNLPDLLSQATSLPFTVENNANAAAFGALYAQPWLSARCTLFLKLGTGCGGAAIINGRLLRGTHGTALEVGHIRLTEAGARCGCGQTGCLETWVNLAALARRVHGRDDLSDAELARLPAEVAAKADQGDARAIAAVDSFAHYLGLGLVSLVNLFNPATILLGGVLRPVLARALPALRQAVAARIIPGTHIPDILLSTLGPQECAIGAACLAHHKTFDVVSLEVAPTLSERLGAGAEHDIG